MEASYEKDEVEGPLKKLGDAVGKVVDAVKGEAKKGGYVLLFFLIMFC